MTLHQLERDLDIAVEDATLLVKTQISVAVAYLSQGLSFEPSDIRELLDEILSEYPERPKLQVVAGTKWRQ
jgi:hypothetical protein